MKAHNLDNFDRIISEVEYDIKNLAEENSCILKEKYFQFLDEESIQKKSEIEKFQKEINKKWNLSINVKSKILSYILESGEISDVFENTKSIFELLPESMQNGIKFEKGLRNELSEYYDKRKKFEEKFNPSGTSFKYGTLYINGFGLEKFGDFCLIFDKDKFEDDLRLFFIKNESLTYIDDLGHFNIRQFSQELCNKKDVSYLVVLKYLENSDIVNENILESMLTSRENYIEALIQGKIGIDKLKVIRIRKERYNEMLIKIRNLFVQDIEKLSKIEIHQISHLLKNIHKNHLKLEAI